MRIYRRDRNFFSFLKRVIVLEAKSSKSRVMEFELICNVKIRDAMTIGTLKEIYANDPTRIVVDDFDLYEPLDLEETEAKVDNPLVLYMLAHALLRPVNPNINLRELFFCENIFTVGALKQLMGALEATDRMETVSFDTCHVPRDAYRYVASYLKKSNMLRSFSLTATYAYGPTNTGLLYLLPALEVNTSLLNVDLSYMYFGSVTLGAWQTFFFNNRSLRSLSVTGYILEKPVRYALFDFYVRGNKGLLEFVFFPFPSHGSFEYQLKFKQLDNHQWWYHEEPTVMDLKVTSLPTRKVYDYECNDFYRNALLAVLVCNMECSTRLPMEVLLYVFSFFRRVHFKEEYMALGFPNNDLDDQVLTVCADFIEEAPLPLANIDQDHSVGHDLDMSFLSTLSLDDIASLIEEGSEGEEGSEEEEGEE